LDDHADIIEVECVTECQNSGRKKSVFRRFCLNRFWRLDDDGVYLITYNSTILDDSPPGMKVSHQSTNEILVAYPSSLFLFFPCFIVKT
jgi:hypothetical protein